MILDIYKMANNNVPKIICANAIQENKKRLLQARIKSQVLRRKEKDRIRQDLNKLFHKLNQAVKRNSVKSIKNLNLSCYNKNVTNCWYGSIPGFPPGSWWGIRMDCSRDRVHNPFDADMDEGPFGVTSVCTSHTNVNKDVDLGDFLTLTGQIYSEEYPSKDPFICNYKNQIPLRLIRSYNLQDDIAPNTGYRYDGLYIVMSCWIGVETDGTKYNKFALMRLTHQELPSWSSKTSEHLLSTQHYISSTRSNHSKPCSSNTYELRKYSYNIDYTYGKRKFSYEDNCKSSPIVKTASSIDTRKSIPESSIVTRHVFNKPSNTENTIYSASISDRKILRCFGASTAKTHNTNISIRMGLYESSYNAQEAKKSISTMLYKPFKPIDIANHTALNIESICLPTKEDKKFVARIDADKVRTDTRSIENISRNEQIAIDNTVNEVISPFHKRRKSLCSHIVYPSECSPCTMSSSLNGSNNSMDVAECKEHFQIAECSANVLIQKLNPGEESQTNLIAMHEKAFKHHDTSKTLHDSLCAQNIKSSLKSLDSLTPDTILNLINNEKHHPLSKLLIGNVIGLTIEECAMWDTRSRLVIPDVSSKINHKQKNNVKENVAYLSEDVSNRKYCKYSRPNRLSWKMKQTDLGKYDKILFRQACSNTNLNCNSKVARMKDQSDVSKKNEYLPSFRAQTSLQTIAQHTRSAYDIKTRLRDDKGVTKQELSSLPIKKSRCKKWDREIANLSIDAKIGPKTRGPRNRRLRCINNIYTNKRHYDTFDTVIYLSGKRNRKMTEKQQYRSSFKRKSKPIKVTRVQDSRNKETRYSASNTVRTRTISKDSSIRKKNNFENASSNNDGYKNNMNESDRKKENRTVIVDVDDRDNVSKTPFDRSLQKKLMQTVSLTRRSTYTSRLHHFHKKQMEKPSTVDAMTQCRLISEEPIENNIQECIKLIERENLGSMSLVQLVNQSSTMNIEWAKPEKIKSESVCDVKCNNRGSRIHETLQLRHTSALTESNERYTDSSESLYREPSTGKTFKDRTSAFVPVNAVDDSDLRIARLRSIGFKPIIKSLSPLLANEQTIQNNQNIFMNMSKVTKRNVTEEYDKYTNNEDNSMVIYMDDELQYQDIEEEENKNLLMRDHVTSLVKTSTRSMLKNVQSNGDTIFPETLTSYENVESPWHGWKKIIMNNQSYWIGW